MTAVTLACPHCAGSIHTDSAYAGQQVACPLCQGALMLPPIEVLAPFAAQQPALYQPQPAPYEQPVYQPPLQEQIFTLACPVCGNGLQVTSAMSGQQVGCPYCANLMLVPQLGWQAPQAPLSSPTPTYQPAAETHPQATQTATQPTHEHVDLASLLPPGALPAPLEQQPPAPAPLVQQSTAALSETTAPRESAPRQKRETRDDRMPPTRGERSSKSEKAPAAPGADRFPPKRSEPTPPANDRFPPGFGGSKPRDAKDEARKDRKTEAAPVEAPRNDRLPPPRREAPTAPEPPPAPERVTTPAQEKLPEAERPKPELQPAESPKPEPPPTTVDDLLPPGAAPQVLAAPIPVPAPTALPEPSPGTDAFQPPGDPSVHASQPAPLAPPPDTTIPKTPSALDHLLPPGAADVNTAAIGRTTSVAPQKLIDSLLPPGTPSEVATSTGSEKPLPKLQPGPLRPILAPLTADKKSGLDSLQGKKSDEKVSPEEEMETKRLTALDRSRRRFRRNAVIWSLCLLILFAVFYFMSR